MLVAISGAQGCGKTTVLNRIRDLGFRVIDRKTSRSILNDWNTSLEEVYGDPVRFIDFQEELIRRKAEDEREAISSSDLWFTERSYADLFAYATIVAGKDNRHADWLNSYYQRCQVLQSQYLMVYYLLPFSINADAENDGVRSVNRFFVSMVDSTVKLALRQLATYSSPFSKSAEIVEVSEDKINQRVKRILVESTDKLVQTKLY